MFENRINGYLPGANLGMQNAAKTSQTSSASTTPLHAVQASDLYQAAYERAKRDHELDRLFNADFYEAGDGI